ncbi:MAG: DUF4340 domain-containing protein [Acidobacteriaceae bacterium]|jgi:hypothetical protein|nr:DUF4340 domain-containing protein [Acidobacteriaceae bacterium]
MKRLWSTLTLFVVLAGLGAYIYFTGAKPADEKSEQPKLFANLEAAQIADLTVKSASGEETTLHKAEDGWKLTAPIATAASETSTTGIVNALADMQVVRVVDENPSDLKEFGLAPPRATIAFKTADGKTTGTLLVGEKTTTGGNIYAQRQGETRVVLVGQYYESTLNQSTFDLRDKTIVKFDPAKVSGLDLTINGKSGELTKTGDDWKVVTPAATRADNSAAEGLLTRVTAVQMKSAVTGAPSQADLKKFGLEKPDAVITIRVGADRTGLVIGGKAAEDTVYVRETNKPDIFTIDATAADELKKPVDEYRRKEMFDFRAFTATRIEITHEGKTLTLERVKSDKPEVADSWKRLTPTASDADREKVESFLANLADIRAVSFQTSTASTGLNTPVMTAIAKFDEGKKEEKVTFGKNGDAAYATRTDEPGVAKIDPSKFDDAITNFTELIK